jgi:hypothetical protein
MPPMTYRFLGRSGLQVSTVSLGGWLTYGGHVEKGTIFHSCGRLATCLVGTGGAPFGVVV